jgi:predicted SnoaL-like aldol condensation-catalyzing enzyme
MPHPNSETLARRGWLRSSTRPRGHAKAPTSAPIGALALALWGAAPAYADADANKALVLAYYEAAFNQRDFDKAVQYLSPHYKQHRPTALDGPEGLRKSLDTLREKFPKAHGDIKHVVAEGDFVMLHILFKRDPEGRGEAIADVYRLADGKIAEHWDVSQPVPETSANPNGMF